jgi:hypothetical protein
MQAFRQTSQWLRLALAVLFAAITVVQVQAMTIACTSQPVQHTTHAQPQHDHHNSDAHADHHRQHAPSGVPHDSLACQDMNCCIAVTQAAVAAPDASSVPLGLVTAAPARIMLATPSEPADPPPRLQV